MGDWTTHRATVVGQASRILIVRADDVGKRKGKQFNAVGIAHGHGPGRPVSIEHAVAVKHQLLYDTVGMRARGGVVGALDADRQKPLEADLIALIDSLNVARDGSMVVPGEYLETVIVKKLSVTI